MSKDKKQSSKRDEDVSIFAALDGAGALLESPSSHQADIHAANADKAGELPQLLAVDAYCRFKFGGKNFDQSAGFVSWAKRQKLRKLPQLEWDALLENFMNRKVGV